MKPWTSWLARLGLAGSCLLWAGCGGGSDVPDPDSDSKAAATPAPSSGPTPTPAPAPVAARSDEPAAATPAAPTNPGAISPPGGAALSSSGAKPGDATAKAGESPAAEGSDDKTAGKSEPTSATTEMLALAGGTAPSAEKPAEGGDQANAAAPGAAGMRYPGATGGPGGQPGAPGMPQGYAGAGTAAGYPGAAGAASAMPGYPGASGGPGAAMPGYPGAGGAGMAGMPGGSSGSGGGPGGAAGPADYRTPTAAVTTFLAALRAKDPERLADATALHAATESSAHYRKVFTAIIEQSLAPEDIDEIAKKFEGMNVMDQNQPKSSGRLGIIVGKSGSKGNSFTRTITVRKEKGGWKVCDISGQHEFEAPINIRGMPNRGRRR
jgi:hypothetical protein